MIKSLPLLIIIASCLGAGCISFPSGNYKASGGIVLLTPQWRTSTGSNVRTVEVFVENGTEEAVSLFDIAVGGEVLPSVPPERRKGRAMPLWWRIAPSGDVPPGGHAVVAICFTNAPAPFELSVAANGERLSVAVPAPSPPRKRVADVVFALRGREVFVKDDSRGVPADSLRIDGRETPFRVLADGRRGRPFVIAARAPSSLREGDRVLVEVRFADGGRAIASARVLRKPVLRVEAADRKTRNALGADESPLIFGAPFDDVGCYDLEVERMGDASGAMLRHLAKGPFREDKLPAVRFCTGCTVQTWDVYGAIMDAAISTPFPALRLKSPSGRLDLEEEFFLRAADASAPRPVLWTAQLFRHGETEPPPDETLAAFWMTLALGSRGICAYLWKGGSGYTGMDSLPEMRETWSRMTTALRRNRDKLFPLVAADRFDAAGGRLKVYTAWNPDRGMLVVWRSADAATLAEPADFEVRMPEWLLPRKIVDLANGDKFPPALDHGTVHIAANSGGSHGAFWIECKGKK